MLSKLSSAIYIHGLSDRLRWLLLLSFCLLFTGLVASRALVSIGMAGILAAGLACFDRHTFLSRLKQPPAHLLLGVHFMIVLAASVYSADKEAALGWLQVKLPFLLLPLAFVMLPALGQKFFNVLLYAFSAVLLASALVVMGQYYADRTSVLAAIEKGGAISTPFSHIRFSLMLVMVVFFQLWLLVSGLWVWYVQEKWMQAAIAVVAVFAIHLLAVRSGLLALYTGLPVFMSLWILKERKWKIALGAVATALLLFGASWYFSDSLQQRVSYMRYDLNRALKGEFAGGSDGMRLLSWKAGWHIFLQHKWTGVGTGDIRAACLQWYETQHPEIKGEELRKVPHNQFLWVMVQAGSWGLIAFCISFFGLWLGSGRWRHLLFGVFQWVIFTSLFTEHTFEEQMGVAVYVVFSLLMLQTFFLPEEKTT